MTSTHSLKATCAAARVLVIAILTTFALFGVPSYAAPSYDDADAKYRQAEEEFEAGRYESSLKTLDAAFNLIDEITDAPRDAALKLRNACDDLRAKIASEAPEVVAEKDYQDAVAAFDAGNARLALRLVESALRGAPNEVKYKNFRLKLDKLESERREADELYLSALRHMEKNNAKDACRDVKKAVALAPNNKEYIDLLARSELAYADELYAAVSDALDVFEESQTDASYAGVAKILREARAVFPKDARFSELDSQLKLAYANRKWRKEIIAGVPVVFRKIMPGEFTMGSPEGEINRDANEAQRRVTIKKEFWMAETETTQALWAAVMGENPSSFKLDFRAGGGELPVESVSWVGCKKFVRRLNKEGYVANVKFALPTEEQWEYACRAGTTTPFSFGATLYGEKANCNGVVVHGPTAKGRSDRQTVKTRSYAPNSWGLYDMHGNVWEWCESEYALKDVQSSDLRVIRGGSWFDAASACRSAKRQGNGVDHKSSMIGFRLIMTEQ